MHELSVVASIVEQVLEFADRQQARQVVEVRLAIGELTTLQQEQLRFCFESVTLDSPMEGARLEIEEIPARVACPHCSYQGQPRYWEGALHGLSVPTLECPGCGQAAQATQGHECAIKSIRFAR